VVELLPLVVGIADVIFGDVIKVEVPCPVVDAVELDDENVGDVFEADIDVDVGDVFEDVGELELVIVVDGVDPFEIEVDVGELVEAEVDVGEVELVIVVDELLPFEVEVDVGELVETEVDVGEVDDEVVGDAVVGIFVVVIVAELVGSVDWEILRSSIAIPKSSPDPSVPKLNLKYKVVFPYKFGSK